MCTSYSIFLAELLPHCTNLYYKWNKNSMLRVWIGPVPWFILGAAESAEV